MVHFGNHRGIGIIGQGAGVWDELKKSLAGNACNSESMGMSDHAIVKGDDAWNREAKTQKLAGWTFGLLQKCQGQIG